MHLVVVDDGEERLRAGREPLAQRLVGSPRAGVLAPQESVARPAAVGQRPCSQPVVVALRVERIEATPEAGLRAAKSNHGRQGVDAQGRDRQIRILLFPLVDAARAFREDFEDDDRLVVK
jgi:hypothetical protein